MNVKIEDVTASFVSEKLPEVAKALRDEGAKSVKVDEKVAAAVQAEQKSADEKIAAAKAEGATLERKRIADIQGMAMAGCEDLVAKAIENGTSPEAFAVEQVKFLKANKPKSDAQSALENGEKIAGKVPATPSSTGNKGELKPAEQAKADLEALKALGVKI